MAADTYEQQGFGTGRIGFGARPAVLVVDFQRGFTDPASPLGGSPLVEQAVESSVELLTTARRLGMPVVIPAVISDFHLGNWTTELDSRIYDRSYDVVVQKIGPSLLFQTPAISYLIKQRVDTVIVIGCNTSGCVRATVVDAFSYGFRVMVPQECCGDVERGPHDDNLRDVGRRYADVLSLKETLSLMETAVSTEKP